MGGVRSTKARRKDILTKLIFLMTLSLLIISSTAISDEIVRDPDKLFTSSVEQANKGNIQEAINLMEMALSVAPDDPDMIWNLGLWFNQLGQHKNAIRMWLRYREVDPEDYKGRAKLIETYQVIGDIENRNRERAALFAWYKAAKKKVRRKLSSYRCDAFSVSGTNVIAFESFEPEGDRMVFYTFAVLNSDYEVDHTYSLGSYKMTTQTARGLGDISDDERLYHLDRYMDAGHKLCGFLGKLPSYDETKKMVVDELVRETVNNASKP